MKNPVVSVSLVFILCLYFAAASPCRASDESTHSGQVRDGSYLVPIHISPDISDSDQCILSVKDGEMKVLFSSGGNSCSIPIDSLDKKNGFSVPDASDKKMHAGYVTVFSADLPEDAFSDDHLLTAADLGLEDGKYEAEVTLSGGSGKASVSSPAILEIKDGRILAEIVWSSPHYDYMRVDGERFEKLNTEGNSMFRVPVAGFDADLPVIGDTTAMSRPHEIAYTLRFSSGTVCPLPDNKP